MSDSRRGFGLNIGFINYLQVLNANNNNTIADFHTVAHAKSFQSVFTSSFLTTDFNKVIIVVSLNYSKYHFKCNTHKVFSSQLDFQLSTHSQSYFTTGGLPPISSWRQAPWDPRPVISFSN
jgi:hypothetical protein